MNSDLIDLLSVFNAENIKYLVVGGHAFGHYVEPRYTKDFDVWIAREPQNAKNIFKALASFGAPLETMQEQDFLDPDLIFQMGRPPNRVDIITAIDGITFEEAWENKLKATLHGVDVFMIGIFDLIKNKKASARPQDLLDVARLETVLQQKKQ